jgi:hypothetical protein
MPPFMTRVILRVPALARGGRFLHPSPLRLFATSRWTFSPSLSVQFEGGSEVYVGSGLLSCPELLASLGAQLAAAAGAEPAAGSPPVAPSAEEAYLDNRCAEGAYTYHAPSGAPVGSMLVSRTAFGDGMFEDSEGRGYAADGGVLAVASASVAPPALRHLGALAGALGPFSPGHFVRLPAGAAVRVAAEGGRFTFTAGARGGAPFLVLDTGASPPARAEPPLAGPAAEEAGLGAAAGVPLPELLRALRERAGDAAFALSVCKVLGFRAGVLLEEEGAAAAAARAVLEGGGLAPLRAALEGHPRSADVCFIGFSTLKLLGDCGAKGFASEAAPLLPAIAAALGAHAAGGTAESAAAAGAALAALDAVMKGPQGPLAAHKAGLPARVTECLRLNLADERLTGFAILALHRLAREIEGGGFADGGAEDATAAVEGAMRAYPEHELIEHFGVKTLALLK